MRRALQSAPAAVRASRTYLRALFVLVGAALALALGVVDVTVVAVAVRAGVATWAVVVIGIVLVGGPLMVGVVPAVRQVEGVAAQTLLAVRLGDGPLGPAVGWAQRRRTLAWFVLHVLAGAVVVAAVIGVVVVRGGVWTAVAAAATLVGTLALGGALARLAPLLLGPSAAERLRADAARATERNRIARELHDSIGHALSLVTMQASAARKMINRDPDYTARALDTIETTSRRAVADLDHMLGLLRDDPQRPATTAPAPRLEGVDGLLDAARSAGLTVDAQRRGPLADVPALVSREAYRIVQEGLTNALKYSADGTATLRLAVAADVLDIEVTNPTRPGRARRAGRGLRGIEERAATLRGNASVGEANGQWRLSVALPTGS
jgi:signal transduction histidine kinase